MLKLKIGYPTKDEELKIMRRMAKTGEKLTLNTVVSSKKILDAREVINEIYVDKKLKSILSTWFLLPEILLNISFPTSPISSLSAPLPEPPSI